MLCAQSCPAPDAPYAPQCEKCAPLSCAPTHWSSAARESGSALGRQSQQKRAKEFLKGTRLTPTSAGPSPQSSARIQLVCAVENARPSTGMHAASTRAHAQHIRARAKAHIFWRSMAGFDLSKQRAPARPSAHTSWMSRVSDALSDVRMPRRPNS